MNSGLQHNSKEDHSHLVIEHGKAALRLLYDSLSPVVYGVLFKMVDDEKAALGLLEKSWLHAGKTFDDYDASKQSLLSWLLGIARKQAEAYRAGKGQYNEPAGLQHLITLLKNKGNEESEEVCRKMLELVYFNGYSIAALSKAVCTAPDLIQRNIRKAIKNVY